MEEKKIQDDRYRLVIFSDSTFEEIKSLAFRPWHIYLGLGVLCMAIAGLVIAAISLTPLRALFVPSDYTDSQELLALREKVLQLEETALAQDLYIRNFRNVITGDVLLDTLPVAMPEPPEDSASQVQRIDEDDQLRDLYDLEKKLEQITRESPKTEVSSRSVDQLYLIPPLTGTISMHFDPQRNHLGVDVNAAPNTPVKSVLSGHIIFSGWTLETGNTIGIQHDNNLISFYKHNSSLLKKAGALVKAGEAVAIIGNTGTLSSGPHLHFELWLAGKPVDPSNYINFE